MKIRVTAEIDVFYLEDRDKQFIVDEIAKFSDQERLLLSVEQDTDDTIIAYVKVLSYE